MVEGVVVGNNKCKSLLRSENYSTFGVDFAWKQMMQLTRRDNLGEGFEDDKTYVWKPLSHK
jgi:hypothetical protein